MTQFRIAYWHKRAYEIEDYMEMEVFGDELKDKVSAINDSGDEIIRIDMSVGNEWKTVRRVQR